MGQGEDLYAVGRVVHFYVNLFAYFGFYGAFLMLLQRYCLELNLYLDIRMVRQHAEALVSITIALSSQTYYHRILSIVKMKD